MKRNLVFVLALFALLATIGRIVYSDYQEQRAQSIQYYSEHPELIGFQPDAQESSWSVERKSIIDVYRNRESTVDPSMQVSFSFNPVSGEPTTIKNFEKVIVNGATSIEVCKDGQCQSFENGQWSVLTAKNIVLGISTAPGQKFVAGNGTVSTDQSQPWQIDQTWFLEENIDTSLSAFYTDVTSIVITPYTDN